MMMRPISRAVALALLTAAATATPALAADKDATANTPADTAANDAGTATLDKVVVSAEKRVTNLQQTPISVSVVNAESLSDNHAISLESLADGSVPSLRVTPFATRSSALTIGMRGVGAALDANQPARDAGVGVYIDGVFLGRSQGLGMAMLDVERIEVLKGPQGTLFGRNTEGGAISIVTKQPTGEFGLRATAGISNYGGHNASAHLDLPRVGDFSFKIDGVLDERGGTVDNPMRGERDFNSYDKRGLRFTTLWQPSDNFQATYAYDYSYDATTPYYAQTIKPGPFASPLQIAGVSSNRRDSAILGGPEEDSIGITQGHMLTMDWTLADNLQLKSISSYRELTQGQFDQGLIDAISTFSPNGTFGRYSLAQVWQHQYSEELQLIGNTDTVQYVFGAFYYKEAAADNAQTPLTDQWNADGTAYTIIGLPLDLDAVRIDRASKAWTTSLGVFGQATWTPASFDRLHVTAGGRWTDDKKNGVLRTVNDAPSSLAFDGKWSRFDPMVNVAYDLSDDVMVYAKYSTGFRAGGANSRSFSYRAFGPEEVDAYELGFKSQFWDNRARFNLALFDSKIKNKQMDFFVQLPPGDTRTVADTTNASTTGKAQGAEVEFNIMPLDNLTLSLDYAYSKEDALKAPNPYAAGNPLVTVLPLFTPKNAGSLSADYVVPFSHSALKLHVDGNWSDGWYDNESDLTITDKSFIVNARIALMDVPMGNSGARAEFALWSRNLLNEQHLFYKSNTSTLGIYGIFNDPRTFGAEISINF